MAVTIAVNGGKTTNITTYSVTEDSTPVDPGDTSGGVGTLSITFAEDPEPTGSMLFIKDSIDLSDGAQGGVSGVVNNVTGGAGSATVTGDSRAGIFLATRTAQPFTGTLRDAFIYYLGVIDITSPEDYAIDESFDAVNVDLQGFTGEMWVQLKAVAAVYGAEISVVNKVVVVRPIRQRIAVNKRNLSEAWTVTAAQLAQSVEVYYYNNEFKADTMVYPKGGWNIDVAVQSIEASETLVVELPIEVSMVAGSLLQPTCVDLVDRDYSGPNSVYSVIGKDSLPIPAALWNDNGGSMTVSVGEDTRTLQLTIVGPDDTNIGQAPFRLAVSDGEGVYSTIRIIGDGVHFTKEKFTQSTGVSPLDTAQVVGVTVDTPFITSLAQARDAAFIAAGKWSTPQVAINISTVGINRASVDGTFNYPSMNFFDGWFDPTSTKLLSDFDATYAGYTLDDFNDDMALFVVDSFDNQAFGNVAGARVRYREAMYRIRSATITESSVSYNAERDTIMSDFDEVWGDATCEQFNARFDGISIEEFSIIPLWGPIPPYASDALMSDFTGVWGTTDFAAFATEYDDRTFEELNMDPLWQM